MDHLVGDVATHAAQICLLSDSTGFLNSVYQCWRPDIVVIGLPSVCDVSRVVKEYRPGLSTAPTTDTRIGLGLITRNCNSGRSSWLSSSDFVFVAACCRVNPFIITTPARGIETLPSFNTVISPDNSGISNNLSSRTSPGPMMYLLILSGHQFHLKYWLCG